MMDILMVVLAIGAAFACLVAARRGNELDALTLTRAWGFPDLGREARDESSQGTR